MVSTKPFFDDAPITTPKFHDGYENQVLFKIKPSNRDEFCALLNVKILIQSQPPSNQQILTIELTDETNPYFLYTMEISDTEFHRLRNEQALLVDFQSFPKKIIELIELCIHGT